MSRLIHPSSWLALVLLWACDRQVDTQFQGDSLLRIRASVAIPLGLEGRELVPAIAFSSVSPMRQDPFCLITDHVRFVEVGVKGAFPSNFTLDVYDPPPPEAMNRLVDGPAFAAGAVTALPMEHPEALMTWPFENETFQEWQDSDRDICYDESDYDEREPGTACMAVHTCTLDAKRCLHQELSCDIGTGGMFTYNDCELVDASGDAALSVAGYSINYTVMYFAEPVKAGTILANIWSGGEPISAGYHLYHLSYEPKAEAPASDCPLSAVQEASERYNSEHGTDVDSTYFASFTESGVTLEERDDWSCEVRQAMKKRGCSGFDMRVEEVGEEPISIELGALNSTSFR